TEEQPVNKSVGPSLEDTGHWIEANLVGLHEEEQHAPHKTTITKASVKGCTLSFTQEDTEGDRTNWTISETMDLGRIEWLKAIPVQKAILGATKGDDVELHYVSMPDQDGKVTPPESRRTSAVGIETDDDAMAARMVKALQHAIDLCKATAKPDLF
ncbi:MAG: hypothetical protein KGK08_13980, partial [Acidobacteriota bacterium]|nr:hypothetical protein [Acidobacteriota bacterium]